MAVVLTNTGIQFPSGLTQTLAAKSYTQQRYTSSSNIGATTVSFTGIPTDAKSIIIAASALSFSSGPNSPKVELWSGSTVLTGNYRAWQNVNFYGSGTTYSNGSPYSSTGYSNLFSLQTYSETPQFIIELKRVPTQAAIGYMYTYYVNTSGSSSGNQLIGTGQVNTTQGSYIGFDKVVVGNNFSYNIVTSDISVFYK
jgi:hypothetical protein